MVDESVLKLLAQATNRNMYERFSMLKKWEELTALERFKLVDSVDWKKFTSTGEQTQYVRQLYESLDQDQQSADV